MVPRATSEHFDSQERITKTVTAGVRRAWKRMRGRRWSRAWASDVAPQVVRVVTEGQRASAAAAGAYLAAANAELDLGPDVPSLLNLDMFAGVSGAGVDVGTAAYSAVIQAAKAQYSAGYLDAIPAEVERQVLAEAEELLVDISKTILTDTMRAAETAALAQRPWIDGYIRMIEPGACSRCVVLAGKFYLFNEGFDRHPKCKCEHIPYREDRPFDITTNPQAYFDSLTKAEQDEVFTKAGAEAIRLGADISQVVNARRGMSTAQQNPRGWIPKGRLQAVTMFGRDAFVTTEGVTKKGIYGKTRGKKPVRLMPESIVSLATDREDAIRLLKLYGFITG